MSDNSIVTGFSGNIQSSFWAIKHLISSILWNPPDTPAWVSFNNYLIFYFARGLICIQSNAMCPGTLANKTICPAQ